LSESWMILSISLNTRRKATSQGDFVSVMSGLSRGTMGWVERIVDDTVHLLEYKEEGNVSTSFEDSMRYEFHVNWLKLTAVPFLHTSSTLRLTILYLKQSLCHGLVHVSFSRSWEVV